MKKARSYTAALLIVVLAVTGLVGCGASTHSKVCASRSAVLSSVAELRDFNFAEQDAASLSGVLDSLSTGLQDLEHAVPSTHSGRVVTLSNEFKDLVQGLGGTQNLQSGDLSELRLSILPRAEEAASIATSVTGC